MNQSVKDPFNDVLVYTADLPVSWQVLQQPLSANDVLNNAQHNSHVLDTVLAIDDPAHEFESVDNQNTQHLRHLDNKLNLLLHWTACLMQQSQQLPASLPVRLSDRGMAITVGTDLQLDAILVVECYPAAYFPQALKLFGRVYSVTQVETIIAFEELSEHVQDLLDKFIFRWHRRSVALSREHKSTRSSE